MIIILFTQNHLEKNNPSFIKYKFQQLQIDLIDLSSLSNHNNGNNFLLTAICSFTKKAWIQPLKSKSGKDVLIGFKEILKRAQKIPSSILSDSGKEFRNKIFLSFCKENNIKTYEAFSSFHGAIVERFNQSIKNRLFKWMDFNKTENYLPYLSQILEGYNNTEHSSTDVSPNLAWRDKSLHPIIRDKNQKYYNSIKRIKPRFKIGDIVRIKSLTNSAFTKGYDVQNNSELFTVETVTSHLPIPLYEIKSLNNPLEGKSKGKFYGYEMTKVTIENNEMKMEDGAI